MAIFQFGSNVTTRAINNVNVELRDDNGVLLDNFFGFSLITWDYLQAAPFGAGGDSLTDELIAGSGNNLIFWDWETVSDSLHPGPVAGRYFLPAGNATSAIEIFRLGDGNDILNLTYDTIAGGVAYGFSATAYGGSGNDLIMSGSLADQLFGDEGADTVFGGGGNDIIDLRGSLAESFNEFGYGGSGNDSLYGDGGNDSLSGGLDDDRIEGGVGLDTINGDDGNDTLYGGDGEGAAISDVVDGGSGNDTLYGGAGIDNILGGNGFLDRLFGGDHNDNITDTDGFLLVSGGAGDDTLYSNVSASWVATGNLATVYGGGGGDSFSMNSGQQNLNLVIQMDDGSADAADIVVLSNVFNNYATVTATMGGGSDSYYGTRGGSGTRIDRVSGDDGNDTLYGGSGSDTLYGGAGFLDLLIGGTQTALASDAGDVLFDSDGVVYAGGGEGDDSFNITFASNWTGAGGNASDLVTLDGNGGNDSMVLSSGNTALRVIINGDDGTADGNDTVDWGQIASSYDRVTATLGDGNDNYIGTGPGASGNLIDIVFGGLGNDTLSGGIGDDTVYGSTAANPLADGNDTLFGRGGNDTLYGGYGLDTFDGGAGDDAMYFNADNTVTGDNTAQDYIQAWDGGLELAQYSYNGRTVNWTFDTFEGNGGIDSLIGTSGNDVLVANTDDLIVNGASQTSNPGRLAGMEVVLLGAGADYFIANDPNGNSTTGTNFTTSITVFAGEGIDVVYTGDGNDLLVGDETTASPDVLAGGAGNDTIWGDLQGLPDSSTGARDSIYGGGGNDTLYGGAAADSLFGGNGTDTIDAGAGEDYIFDSNNAGLLFGGDGGDTFILGYQNAAQAMSASRTGADAVSDGDDKVFIVQFGGVLAYASVSMSLGAGSDVFISGNTTSGNGIDRIAGESGNDIISSWSGNDTLDGGSGADVIWGGAGTDTIYGGAQDDYLYGGSGDGDVIVGGDGVDFYYWARTDGNDRIADFDPTPADRLNNYILVYAGFQDPANPSDDLNNDGFIDGNGVFETDGNLYDNDGNDMVQLVDLDGAGAGTAYELRILTGAGVGSALTFDRTEVTMIGLSNSDTGQVWAYQWIDDAGDPLGGRYVLIN